MISAHMWLSIPAYRKSPSLIYVAQLPLLAPVSDADPSKCYYYRGDRPGSTLRESDMKDQVVLPSPQESKQRGGMSPSLIIFLAFFISFTIYLLAFTLPFNLFTYAGRSPVSFPEIAKHEWIPALAFLLVFVVLFLVYILAYRICRRHPDVWSARLIILSGLGLALALIMTYPIGASDVIDYVAHGEELAHLGANPMVTPPASTEGGVFTDYSAYRYSTSGYGPVFTWISALVAKVMGRESLALNILGFKVVALAAYLVQALVIHAILKRRQPEFSTAGLLLFAWNPLILYEFAANAHNDATMMAFAMLGIFFWDRRRPLLMAAFLTASFLVKIPTAPLLPLFILSAARQESSTRRSLTTLVGCGLVSVILVVITYLPLPNYQQALTNLAHRSHLFTHSLPTIASKALQLYGLEETIAQAIARTAALLALFTWYLFQLWRTWRQPSTVLLRSFDTVLFLLLFATLWFQPWYVTWLVALGALRPRPPAPSQAALFSFCVLLSYVVYGFVWFWIRGIANWGDMLGINLIAVGTSFLASWAYALYLWIKSRGSQGVEPAAELRNE